MSDSITKKMPFPARSSVILSVFFSCGIIYPAIAHIDNNTGRYALIHFFLWPMNWLYSVPQYLFHTSKDIAMLNAYTFITPIALIASSAIWVTPLWIFTALIKKSRPSLQETTGFCWATLKISFLLALLLFFLIFVIPLPYLVPDVNPHYSNIEAVVLRIISIFSLAIHIPEFVPELLAFSLDKGGDTLHGYDDLYALAMTAHALGPISWAMIFVGSNKLYTYIIQHRRMR